VTRLYFLIISPHLKLKRREYPLNMSIHHPVTIISSNRSALSSQASALKPQLSALSLAQGLQYSTVLYYSSNMDPIVAISPALYASISPTATESTFTTSPIKQEIASIEPPKKKQKRNKPTLSCEECVERKTKVGNRCACQNLKKSINAR
jgi:hypothetical protein